MNAPFFLPDITNFLLFSPHERGDYRPPFEAQSLILRLTENCDNAGRCKFCTYTSRTPGRNRFRERELSEVEEDIEKAAQHYHRWLDLLEKYECRDHSEDGASHRTQMLKDQWYQRAFFQEANALFLDTAKSRKAMELVKAHFPHIREFSSFGSAKVLGNPRHPRYKSLDDLASLHEIGLRRVYMGLESGADEVLGFMGKGSTAENMIHAGQNLKKADMEICLSFILGLGGTQHSQVHAQETAWVLNAVQPDIAAALGLFLNPSTPLHQEMQQGRFTPATVEQILDEKEYIIRHIDFPCSFSCSHVANFLNEVAGELPQDRETMLEAIDRYRSLGIKEKLLFFIGSRDHWYPSLDHFFQDNVEARYKKMITALRVKLNRMEREGKEKGEGNGYHTDKEGYFRSGRRLLERLQNPGWDYRDKLLMLRLWEKNRQWLEEQRFFSLEYLTDIYSRANLLFPPKVM
jgi:hypothetical protein